jgi:methylated-DNA-[protein]-cysteine S-methyltransferase
VDNPKGFRAVAQANGRNPLSLIIPCHRVIASDGKLGGYTGGIEIKQTLLDIEQASYQR